jgi:hypothetical protein
MPTNEFLPFASGTDPNVMSQSDYAALSARTGGFQSGTALSDQVNKVWRQSANMASAWGAVLLSYGLDALDDGDISTLGGNLRTAISGTFNIGSSGWQKLPSGLIVQWGTATVGASGLVTSGGTVTWPTAFPAACRLALASPGGPANSANGYLPSCGFQSFSTTGGALVCDTLTGGSATPIYFNQTAPVRWIAFGN